MNLSFAQRDWLSALPADHPLYSSTITSPGEDVPPLEEGFSSGHQLSHEQLRYASPTGERRYASRAASNDVGRHWFVRTNHAQLDIAQEGWQDVDLPATIELPLLNEIGELRQLYFHDSDLSGINSVTGEVEYARATPGSPGEPCRARGSFGLVRTVEGLSGWISTSDGSYSIAALSDSVSIIYEEVALPDSGESGCGACDAGAASSTEFGDLKGADYVAVNGEALEVCTVDLAVAYTARAADREEPAANATLVVDQMNRSLLNSEVYGLRYRLVGVETLPNYEATVSRHPDRIIEELQAIDVDITGDIGNFRERTGADQVLVVLPIGILQGAFGVSEIYDAPATRDLAAIHTGTHWRFTGPHELAHNHGCKHDNDTDTGTPGQLQSYARGWVLNGESASVMAITPPSGSPQRIFHFSNPNVFVSGVRSGTFDNNNARQLVESACQMAELHGSDGRSFTGIAIRGGGRQGSRCAGTMSEWRYVPLNCEVQTVRWSVAIGSGPFIGYGTSPVLSFRLPRSRGYVTVRAEVSCGSGSDLPDFHLVGHHRYEVESCDPCGLSPFAAPAPTTGSTDAFSIERVAPTAVELVWSSESPASTQPLPRPGEVDEAIVWIVDLLGRRYPATITFDEDRHRVFIQDLPTGQPVVVWVQGPESIHSKIIYAW